MPAAFSAVPDARGGATVEGMYPANIVTLADGSLLTEAGLHSTDGGRTWRNNDTFVPVSSAMCQPAIDFNGDQVAMHQSETFDQNEALGLVALPADDAHPRGQLGSYYADKWTMDTALGNDTNNWFFHWSGDEGRTWSEPVQITLPGLTMGLDGTMFTLRDGRLLLVTYSQFIGSRFDRRGKSVGRYRGIPVDTETEGHFPLAEASRVYHSDDAGRSWQPSDGWIMAWRDQRWNEALTECTGVELEDGRIMLMGRTLTGRIFAVHSDDRGHSWWPAAEPTELMSSYSPGRLVRIATGDLLFVWNQASREETRKGLRRSRLSSAISRDEGRTWGDFRNLEAVACLADTTCIPPDPDMSPLWGDDEVGDLPDDFGLWHYPKVSVVGNEVFVSYAWCRYEAGTDEAGNPKVNLNTGSRMRILPAQWFYT